MREFLKKAEHILGQANLLLSAEDLTDYAAWPVFGGPAEKGALPLAVARPVNLAQARELLLLCGEAGVGCRLRGGGTSPLAAKCDAPHIILATGALNRILELDLENRVARVQAGVTLDALEKACAQNQLFFPPAVPCGSLATIGGIIAMNAQGAYSAKYGPASAYVQTLEVLASTGRRFTCHAQNLQPEKVAPSFPMAPLFCGSGGCLGLIGAASLRLLPLPESSQSLAAVFPDGVKTAEAATTLATSKLMPDRLEYLNGLAASLLTSSDMGEKGMVLSRFSGDASQVGASMAKAREIFSAVGAREILECDQELFHRRDELMTIAAALNKAVWPTTAACPPSRFSGLIENVSSIAESQGLATAIFGSASIAQINILFLGDRQKAMEAAKKIFDLSLVLTGLLASEEDLNLGPAKWSEEHAELTNISTQLRKIFDPAGILAINPLPGEVAPC